ncbi:MAG: hypothetical protein JXA90_14025 [Planctomycetes bacterium]|nr:hypothetical protein [Planctomycetota bacterium]
MTSRVERFWILFILRFAFGFFMVVAAINIFSYGGAHEFGPDRFARDMTAKYEGNWMGNLLPMVDIGPKEVRDEQGNVKQQAVEDLVHPTYFFMLALPFLFAILSVPILTGLLIRPAFRFAALLFVCLGIGSYIGGGVPAATAYDFFFAFLLCVGLHYMGQGRQEAVEAAA